MQCRAGLRPRGRAPPVPVAPGRGPAASRVPGHGCQALAGAVNAHAAAAQAAALAAAMAGLAPPQVPPVLPPLVPPPIVLPPGPVTIVAPIVPNVAPPVPVIPPIPADPQGVFEHVLEYVVGLGTQAKWDCVIVAAGCVTADDLMYVETDNLIACLDPATSIIAKTRLKTLKKWVEEFFDVNGVVDVADFTADICRSNERETTKPSTTQAEKSVTKEKLNVWNGRQDTWLKSKRKLMAYLNQIKNEHGIPLYYVIRDPNLEDQYRADSGEIGKRIFKPQYKGRVYSVPSPSNTASVDVWGTS
jgi:hypothetical protein